VTAKSNRTSSRKEGRVTGVDELRALEEAEEYLHSFPGQIELRLQIWREGEQPPNLVGPDVSKGLKQANTLKKFRELLGGDEGFLTDSRGGKHSVSLQRWGSEDPKRTYVAPVWIFTPEKKRLEEWKAFWDEHFDRFPPERGG